MYSILWLYVSQLSVFSYNRGSMVQIFQCKNNFSRWYLLMLRTELNLLSQLRYYARYIDYPNIMIISINCICWYTQLNPKSPYSTEIYSTLSEFNKYWDIINWIRNHHIILKNTHLKPKLPLNTEIYSTESEITI